MAGPRQQFASTIVAWRIIAMRLLLFAGIWWVLTGGGAKAWAMGSVIIVAALTISLRLLPAGPHHVSLTGLAIFFGFFLRRSVIAGVQVARLALQPRMQLRPAMMEIRTHLPHEAERVFLASTLSLLPGTLTTGLDGNMLRVHVLDARQPVEEEIRTIENKVARLFRTELQ